MIRRLTIAVLRWRAAHHDRLTRALGAAVLAAQERRDWDGIGAIWRQREHHRQRRDLLTLRASALQHPVVHDALDTCPSCLPGCHNGSRCLRDF